jgi:hypothetical protein
MVKSDIKLICVDSFIGAIMLKESTVFVVGAGASSEFNLPIGTDLAIEISAKLDVRFDDWVTCH